MFTQEQVNITLRSRVKAYLKRAAEIQGFLDSHPNDWGKFQSEFNQEVNRVFYEIMMYEKRTLAEGDEDKIYKLKRFFEKYFRDDFTRGQYVSHTIKKPFGYAGDFQIIDWIYTNHAETNGFDRLFDNYYLESPASVATRNRKEDFKRILRNLVRKRGGEVSVLDLASGPCRDLYEFYRDFPYEAKSCNFHCLENDKHAIEYAAKLLGQDKKVKFIKENVVRIALKKNIEEKMLDRYDFIFSTGLFDYLDYSLGVRLVSNLKKLLKPDGQMAIANYRDKYSNPSFHFMEWVGEWNLIYRTDDEFKQMFVDAGFLPQNVTHDYEQQGIVLYCFANNS